MDRFKWCCDSHCLSICSVGQDFWRAAHELQKRKALQRPDQGLGVLRIEALSEEDRDYLKSKEAEEVNRRNLGAPQTWKTQSVLELVGRVVDYARGDIVVQRRRGHMYVNDRRLARR